MDSNDNFNINEPSDTQDNNEYYDYLPADHPHLKRLQATLEQKLKREEEDHRLTHKELYDERKKLTRRREDLGVTLYTYQQQFAKMQDQFDTKINKLKIVESQRVDIQKTLDQIQENFNNQNISVKDQEKTILQATEELSQLNRMLKYVEDYNKQITSEIKVTGRNVNKAEITIKNTEKDKYEQDLLINDLIEQIKILTEKKQLYEGQLQSQLQETQLARENLSEANDEIEIISERKKNLLKDWDKSIISMKSRDKALDLVRNNIRDQDAEKLKLNSQINRYNELIQNETFSHSEITHEIASVQMKQKRVQTKQAEVLADIQKLMNKNYLLSNSTDKTKRDIKDLDAMIIKLKGELALIDKNKTKLYDEAKKLSDNNLIILAKKETKDKQTENLVRSNIKLEKYIFDIQVDIDLKLNEIWRTEIDLLNVTEQNDGLKKKMSSMDNEINKLEKDYSNNELIIKRNHEMLENKQLDVDRLNKKLGAITKNKKGEEEGEHETKIRELKTQQINLQNEISQRDNEWIYNKTTLVARENQLNLTRDDCRERRAQKTILDHKKLRLSKVYEMHEKEIVNIEILLKNLGYDMNKYNGLLNKNQESKTKLKHKYFDVEIEFRDKLTQMENQSVKLELEIEVLREEKADTLSQILEIERQIQLWERKIHLEEQMQVIIKPDKGIKEIEEMQTYIHRQKLEYNELKKQQELVIKNMEMALQRRDYIKIRYPIEKPTDVITSRIKSAVPKSSAGMNALPMLPNNKNVGKLNDDLKFTKSENLKFSKLLSDRRGEFDKVRAELYHCDMENKNYINKYNETFMENCSLKIKKNNDFSKLLQNQKTTQLIDEFLANKYKPRKIELVTTEKQEIDDRNYRIYELVKKAKDEYPQYAVLLDSLINI